MWLKVMFRMTFYCSDVKMEILIHFRFSVMIKYLLTKQARDSSTRQKWHAYSLHISY